MALDPPRALLPLLQCLHGLSFGATHLGALAFIARAAPAGLAATAQGYLAVAGGGWCIDGDIGDGGRRLWAFCSPMGDAGRFGGLACATGFCDRRPKHPKI